MLSKRINNTLIIAVLVYLVSACSLYCEDFKFVFMTDIHLSPSAGVDGFRQAVKVVNELKPDFVITGGDLVRDVTHSDKAKANEMFDTYMSTLSGLKMPYYNAIGNHDLAGLSGTIPASDPDFGKGLFEKKVGKLYYSFDHKGWHFIVLDDIGMANKSYLGYVNSEEIKWIKEDLKKVDKKTPIVVVAHMPLIEAVPPLFSFVLQAGGREGRMIVTNSKEVISLFNGYNLKAVLSGHIHVLYHAKTKGVDYITSGAVSGMWWRGPMAGTKMGFLVLNIKNDKLEWKYVSYGWKP